MNQTLFLRPAYGRNYQTQNSAVKDWNAGKDFKIMHGPYCSIRDVPVMKRDGYKYVVILWQPNQQVAMGL